MNFDNNMEVLNILKKDILLLEDKIITIDVNTSNVSNINNNVSNINYNFTKPKSLFMLCLLRSNALKYFIC